MTTKYALIIGTSSGLGLEMALYLLDQGFYVFGASRSGSSIEHSRYEDIICDISLEEEVEQMFEVIRDNTDELHLLVNSAGIFEMSPLIEMTSENFKSHLEINILGAFHILKHFHSFIVEDVSHIIHLASIAAKTGFPEISAYSASKFGLIGLIESCKKEWSDRGVRFSTLNPGAIETSLWDNIKGSFDREKMMTVDEFLYIFSMLVNAPASIQFPDVTFLHRSGVLS